MRWNVENIRDGEALQSLFEYRVRDVNIRIEQRINNYKQILRSVRGLYRAEDKVNRITFRSFFNSLSLDKYYPGVQGVGFSLIIPFDQIKKHTENIRGEGFPEYKIWPEVKRELYTSIIYIEPFKDRNLRAFGYDMFSEPVRRKAMEIARDSNKTTLSGKVFLVQETNEVKQTGFLIYLPVYRNGKPTTSVSERRENIIGWVYSPFRMNDFMDGLFGERAPDLDHEIYDGNIISDGTKMYDSDSLSIEQNGQLRFTTVLNFNGQDWTVLVKSNPGLKLRIGQSIANIILITGISLSILLSLITWLFINKRINTIKINREVELSKSIVEKKNVELIKLNAEKDKFFSIIAHDLRSPFTGFINLTELMADKSESFSQAEVTAYSKLVNEAAINLFELLENLLEWALINDGSIKYSPKNINLSQIVSKSINAINHHAVQKRIAIINETEVSQIVYADEKMIGSVLRNLLSNAVKFTRMDGKVNVKSKRLDNGIIEVSIADNGVGISENDVRRLFKIEEKVGRQGTEGESSTGLGLLLCKEFIDMHGGKIWAESKEEKGSTFYFTLQER